MLADSTSHVPPRPGLQEAMGSSVVNTMNMGNLGLSHLQALAAYMGAANLGQACTASCSAKTLPFAGCLTSDKHEPAAAAGSVRDQRIRTSCFCVAAANFCWCV